MPKKLALRVYDVLNKAGEFVGMEVFHGNRRCPVDETQVYATQSVLAAVELSFREKAGFKVAADIRPIEG